jgi:uncharacterized membrane protein YdjX (TVP38/TMEM64 family)
MKRIVFFRLLPLAIVLAVIIVCQLFVVDQFFSFEVLKAKREIINHFVQEHSFLTPLIFMTIYTISMALAIPDGFFLSVVAGFIFPEYIGIVYVLISEMAGTLIFFLTVRHTLTDYWHKKAGPLLNKLEKGFKENQVSYLLFLRFVHLIPFWLLNLASAYFRVPIWTFTWTTFLGFIPLAFIYTQAGSGLGKILATQDSFSISAVLSEKFLIILICLGLFALLPVFIKLFKKLRGPKKPTEDETWK